MRRFIEQGFTIVFFIVVAIKVVRLLERSIENASRRALSDLLKVVNQLNTAVFRSGTTGSENAPAEDIWEALKIVENIGYRIRNQTPAMRRVLTFNIGIRLDYIREKTGITNEELKVLEPRCSTAAIFPASNMVIEEWATHMVIREPLLGTNNVVYRHQSWSPVVLWNYMLQKQEGEWENSFIQVVLHEDCVKCWAVNGRFGSSITPWEPRKENVFVVIPLNDKDLFPYGLPYVKNPNEEPAKLWIREYRDGDVDTNQSFWSLTVADWVFHVEKPW